MTVWVLIPSAASHGQARVCVTSWQASGYKVAILAEDGRTLGADWACQQDRYPGYAASVNKLARTVLENDLWCRVVVAAGDDMFPDPKRHADEITHEFISHFGGCLGVMQPCGDPWRLGTSEVPQARRVAGSPWLGREWCRRANMGKGPLWEGYYHCFEDNHLAETAERLGLMWWNENVSQRHEHFLRHGRPVPAHAKHAYDRFAEDQATFERLKAEGFPGSELLP